MWLLAYTLLLHIRFINTAVHVTTEHMITGCWPNNIIPYKIYHGFNYKEISKIHSQIDKFNRLSCVRWVYVENVPFNLTDFVGFKRAQIKTTCHTKRGDIVNGEQAVNIELGESCFSDKVILHEMLHVMGFPHEHQRADRDCYVSIDLEEVAQSPQARQYGILHTPWLEQFPYDKTSILHYSRSAIMHSQAEKWYSYYGEPLGNPKGFLSILDLWKIQYRFCGFPHYCDLFPELCNFMDALERSCTNREI